MTCSLIVSTRLPNFVPSILEAQFFSRSVDQDGDCWHDPPERPIYHFRLSRGLCRTEIGIITRNLEGRGSHLGDLRAIKSPRTPQTKASRTKSGGPGLSDVSDS